jgi:hypothetical protein
VAFLFCGSCLFRQRRRTVFLTTPRLSGKKSEQLQVGQNENAKYETTILENGGRGPFARSMGVGPIS